MSDDLSPDAKVVGAAWFGMMRLDGKSSLRFQMIESRPTARAQEALEELVTKGWVARENERRGPVVYHPLKDFLPLLRPLMAATLEGRLLPSSNFPLTEPIAAPEAPESRPRDGAQDGTEK